MLASNQQLLLMQQQPLPPTPLLLQPSPHYNHHLQHHHQNNNNNNNNSNNNNNNNNGITTSNLSATTTYGCNHHNNNNTNNNKQLYTTTSTNNSINNNHLTNQLISPLSVVPTTSDINCNNLKNTTTNTTESQSNTTNKQQKQNIMDHHTGYNNNSGQQSSSTNSLANSQSSINHQQQQQTSNQLATFITTIVSLSPQELNCLCADNLFIDTLREANDVITSKISKIRLMTQQQNHLLLQMHHHQQQHQLDNQQQPSSNATTSMSALDLRSFGSASSLLGQGYDKIDYLAAVALATAANQQHSAAAAVAAAAAAASYLSNNSPSSVANTNRHRNSSSTTNTTSTTNSSASATSHINNAATQYYYDALYNAAGNQAAAAASQLSPGQTHSTNTTSGSNNQSSITNQHNDSHNHMHHQSGNNNNNNTSSQLEQSYYLQRQLDYMNEQASSINNNKSDGHNYNNGSASNFSPSSDRSGSSSYPSPPNRTGSPANARDSGGFKKRKYNQSDNYNHIITTGNNNSNISDNYSTGSEINGPAKKKRINKPRKKPLIETNQSVYQNNNDNCNSKLSSSSMKQQNMTHHSSVNSIINTSLLSGSIHPNDYHHLNGSTATNNDCSTGGLLSNHRLLNNMDHYLDAPSMKSGGSGGVATKKHKGEFDEPTFAEVEQRQRILEKVGNYHSCSITTGECACVLGSQFPTRSARDVLAMVQEWRKLNVEHRVLQKWDAADLPKDIPLSEISKYELLRKEASGGQANFGGTSKRKPLGIRGTRQFLLILYCLWGHPGSQDEMQREGYCPHCFAKIRKANDQSTLVRVVNHFNMKHRQGHNPRLSPTRDIELEVKSIGSPGIAPLITSPSISAIDNTTSDDNRDDNNSIGSDAPMKSEVKNEDIRDDEKLVELPAKEDDEETIAEEIDTKTEDIDDVKEEVTDDSNNLDLLNRALSITESHSDATNISCEDSVNKGIKKE